MHDAGTQNAAVLETRGLTKDFGGLRAVNDVDFQLKKGELMSIIGPNGAGKTTFFNLLSGHLRPTRGEIYFFGDDIRGLGASRRCQVGIGRSFQITNVFPDLTAFENIRVAVQARKKTFSFWRNWKKDEDVVERANGLLNRIGLYEKRNYPASALAYGEQRYLEIGITLATEPRLILLDEPTSGMSPKESSQVASFIKELSTELEILLVEHDMDVVMSISDKVICMEDGSIIACDSPAKIRNNPRVQECYLREKIC
jgi:branched-chain amino acid transport system ATP-binding protein